jgi:hypothetical protein
MFLKWEIFAPLLSLCFSVSFGCPSYALCGLVDMRRTEEKHNLRQKWDSKFHIILRIKRIIVVEDYALILIEIVHGLRF